MPNRRRSSGRKRKKAADDEDSGPSIDEMNSEQFIAHARKQSQAKLSSSSQNCGVDLDLDHLVRTIRAIISTNKEIWQRCRETWKKPSSDESGNNTSSLCFDTITYSTVEASTGKKSYDYQSTYLNFVAEPEVQSKTFYYMPFSLPSELSDMISHTKDEDGLFPNYDHFLQTSLSLHDDVLIPFRTKLKEHLEKVQVFFGEIDAWLMETRSCDDFIQNVFGVELEKQEESFCGGCSQQHARDAICRECGSAFVYHTTYSSYHSNYHRCPNANGARGSFSLGFTKQTLKTCSTNGEYKDKFDLTNENERERLKKFLDFVS